MSPAPWGETSHLQAAAVIVTRAHGCLTATGHCYIMLGTVKFVDKSVNGNSARRLDHCDVIASRGRFGVPTGVPHSEVELQTEFKSFAAVQWELCGTNVRENIANLGVSCYNGNNGRSARVLFVQHPREQGDWLRQNPRYARVLTASFALLPRVLDEQHHRSPVIIP